MKSTSIVVMMLLLACCNSGESGKAQESDNPPTEQKQPVKLVFNADSAYAFVKAQVAFGPRVPGTVPHGLTASYLSSTLGKFCDTAFIQEGEFESVHKGKVPIRNIIGIINPSSNKRVLLCAHWDTRPMADEDPNDPQKPSDGANDGASGVGVLLEVARQFRINRPDLGVDIIFFDAEDMGNSEFGPESWCLGSQYWAEKAQKAGYSASYGILLDMVGPKDAIFAMESHSVIHARGVVDKVWRTARNLGHGNHFIMFQGGMITDDHYFINKIIGIPTIDIIHYDIGSSSGFGDFWHTHKDNMSSIDKESLQAVGETILAVLYSE